ncbi:MAG: hypothetical protein EOO28_29685 [Comamonadaceae bacterium]|nr:MAG: hypothetical protein EOO28_29685 [Comamonadaceae bacterium]
MKLLLLPKYVAAAAWLSSGVLLALAAWFTTGAGTLSSRRPQPSEIQLASQDGVKIQAALDFLQDLKDQQQRVTQVAQERFSVEHPRSNSSYFVAPSPPDVRKLSPATGGLAESAGSSAGASLIIIQSDRRSLAVVDGQPVRVGQPLAGGDVVDRIGKTFVVLRDPAGGTRTLDMQARFSPPSTAVVSGIASGAASGGPRATSSAGAITSDGLVPSVPNTRGVPPLAPLSAVSEEKKK